VVLTSLSWFDGLILDSRVNFCPWHSCFKSGQRWLKISNLFIYKGSVYINPWYKLQYLHHNCNAFIKGFNQHRKTLKINFVILSLGKKFIILLQVLQNKKNFVLGMGWFKVNKKYVLKSYYSIFQFKFIHFEYVRRKNTENVRQIFWKCKFFDSIKQFFEVKEVIVTTLWRQCVSILKTVSVFGEIFK